MFDRLKDMDSREIELPDTVFIRDIETRVFQGLVLQVLAKVSGIGLIEGGLFDNLLGRETESVKGIHVEQDQKKHSVSIRVEIKVTQNVSIPEKSEEIQSLLVEEISKWTGLHVASVHIVFKDLIPKPKETKEIQQEKVSEFEEAY